MHFPANQIHNMILPLCPAARLDVPSVCDFMEIARSGFRGGDVFYAALCCMVVVDCLRAGILASIFVHIGRVALALAHRHAMSVFTILCKRSDTTTYNAAAAAAAHQGRVPAHAHDACNVLDGWMESFFLVWFSALIQAPHCSRCQQGVAYKNRRCAMCRREIPIEFLDHPHLLYKIEETPPTSEDGYQWFYEGRNGT